VPEAKKHRQYTIADSAVVANAFLKAREYSASRKQQQDDARRTKIVAETAASKKKREEEFKAREKQSRIVRFYVPRS
jgi:hypothetical protein